MNRRSFLRRGTQFAAAAGISRALPAIAYPGKALPRSPVRLGIASYTFRKFDANRLMAFMQELHTPYLNLKDVHLPMSPADQVPKLAQVYRDRGLKLTAGGSIALNEDSDQGIQSKFEYCKAAGIPVMVGAPTHATLPRVEKFVKQYDIRLAIHNHGPEDQQWPSPLDVLKAINSMDPRIGCCVDVGHTMRAGVDVVEAIKKAGNRLFDIHMKDLADSSEKDSQVAVGDGIMPVREIFEQLIHMGYSGFVDLEYEIKPEDPMPGVRESFAYMRGVLAGLGYSTAG